MRDVYAKLTLIVWWVTLLLEVTILTRAFKEKILRQYAFFFVYLSCVFLSSASGYYIYQYYPDRRSLYQYWYWSWEFVCVIAGYSVVLETIEKGFAAHEGVRRFFTNAALLAFGAVVVITGIQSVRLRHSIGLLTSMEVERNLRAAEAVLLLAIMVTIAHYAIPIGKNLRGIILGYGLCVATVVIGNSIGSYIGSRFLPVFSAARSWSYLLSLLIWTAALWSYHPNPVPKPPIRSGPDYEVLAANTRQAVESVRGQLEKAAGQ